MLFWCLLVACHHPYKGRAVGWQSCFDETGPKYATLGRHLTPWVQMLFCALH